MCGRRTAKPVDASACTTLDTEDRMVVATTAASDALAREMLQEANGKASDLSIGDEVNVVLVGDHRPVHFRALGASLTGLAEEAGLRFAAQEGDTFTFKKISEVLGSTPRRP